MPTQSEPDLRESQLTQRKTRSFRGSSPSDSGGREKRLPELTDMYHELRRIDQSLRDFEEI
jgi:hypothetical protein